jgi:hypothetical protein
MHFLAIMGDIRASSLVELVTMIAAAVGAYYAYRARRISEEAKSASEKTQKDMVVLKEHTNDKMDKTLHAVEEAAILKGRESARIEGEDKAEALLANQQKAEIERLAPPAGGPPPT